MAIQRRIFHRKLFYLSVFVVIWALGNLAAVSVLKRLKNTNLETKYLLRSGILGEFSPETLCATSVNGGELLLPYRLYKPQTNKKLPVILYLHGAGERGSENCKQLRAVPAVLTNNVYKKSHCCFLIVPQCPVDSNWQSFRKAIRNAGGLKDQDVLIQLIEEVLKNPLADRDRIYLMGFSMGSFESWQLAADHPDHFAAVVPISGGDLIKTAASLTKLPIWAIHGDEDETCQVDGTRQIVAAIKEFGGKPLYSELSGVGHDAWRPAIRDAPEVMDWLFSQKRSSH